VDNQFGHKEFWGSVLLMSECRIPIRIDDRAFDQKGGSGSVARRPQTDQLPMPNGVSAEGFIRLAKVLPKPTGRVCQVRVVVLELETGDGETRTTNEFMGARPDRVLARRMGAGGQDAWVLEGRAPTR
jgi:hypothetical protein